MESSHVSLTLMSMDGKILDVLKILTAEGIWDLTATGIHEGLYFVILKQYEEVFPFKLVIL